MSLWTIDKHIWRDPSWWHWALTIPLLVVNLAGHRWGIIATMGLCAAAGCYLWYCLRQAKPYPVQVRIAYLVWSLVGLLPWMSVRCSYRLTSLFRCGVQQRALYDVTKKCSISHTSRHGIE